MIVWSTYHLLKSVPEVREELNVLLSIFNLLIVTKLRRIQGVLADSKMLENEYREQPELVPRDLSAQNSQRKSAKSGRKSTKTERHDAKV